MRLHPPVSFDEAYTWLRDQAKVNWKVEDLPELEQALRPLAEAMAAVSEVALPETVEPGSL